MAGPKYMKEDSPPWHTACGLGRDGLPQKAESLYRLTKQLDRFIEEKKIHRGQLNTKIPPLAQKVADLQITGGWRTVMGGCFTTWFSCSYTLPTIFWSLFSAEYLTRWTLHLAQHVFHTLCQPLNLHYWTSAAELQTLTPHSDFCLISTDKGFSHKKQALFWTRYGEDLC